MLTHKINLSKKRSAINVSAKLCIKVSDLVRDLKLDSDKEKMLAEYSLEAVQKYLLLNHEVLNILKCSTEILEFDIDEGAKIMRLGGSAQENNKMLNQ